MSTRGVSIAIFAMLVAVVVTSGAAAAADPGTHEVQITNGSGDINASYYYDASAGSINVTEDGGVTWTNSTLTNPSGSALAIQWAVGNTTATHDRVLVGPGTYNGTTTITRNGLSLEGVSGGPGVVLAPTANDERRAINVSASNVSVSSVTFADFDSGNGEGLRFTSGSDNSVTDSTFRDITYGVWVQDGSVTIENNTFESIRGRSVSVIWIDENVIRNNTITDSNKLGLHFHGSEGNLIAGNVVEGGSFSDAAIHLYDGSSDNTVEDNVLRNIGGTGVWIENGGDRSEGNVLSGNQITSTTGTGVLVEGPSNTIVDNEVNATGGHGIYVEDVDGILLEHNVANHNSYAGIYLNVTNESTVRGNEANGNDIGIVLENSTRNEVIGNSASQSDHSGLFLYLSDSNVLEDNVARENQNGVILERATNTSISGTNASDNDVAGFYFDSARNSTVTDVVSADNGLSGFEINFDSFDNEFDNVTATDNDQTAYASSNTVGGTNLITGLDVGTDVTLDVETGNVSISAFDGTAGTPNSDLNALGGLVNVTNTSSPVDADLTFRYSDADASSLDESSVGLWNHTAGNWSEVTSASIDTSTNTVSVSLKSSDTLGLYAESTSASGGSGSGGGGGGYYLPSPSDSGPEFTVTSIGLSSDGVAVDDTVTVTVDIDNDGDEHGDYTGTLTVDGQDVDSGTVTVNSNWHEALALSTSFDEPGTYQLAVDGQSAGSVDVSGESSLSVSDVSTSPASVESGGTVTISATISNDGAAEGTMDVPLTIDGEEVDSQSVTLEPGESETVTFEHTFDESGPVIVAGESAGSVQVQDDSADSAGDTEESEGSDDGVSMMVILFGGLGLVVAGGAGAYVVYPERVKTTVERLQVKADGLLETYRE